MPLRLLMMGTGTFARPTFRELLGSGHHVVGLVTQPDRVGRGHHHHPHPMKELALAQGVDVFQPVKVNAPESLERLAAFEADVFVVAAYGQILSAKLLGLPRLGAINAHASLLPRHRGAAPVQYAIWCGDRETGVSIFRIEPHLDAGPILGMSSTEILPHETGGELEERLSEMAATQMRQVVDDLERGTAREIPQDPAGVTLAPRMKKEMGHIDWTQPSARIACMVRALQPWPTAFTDLLREGSPPLRIQILEVQGAEKGLPADEALDPGTIRNAAGALAVRTGDGWLEMVRLQPSGKRAMSGEDFLRGHALVASDRFGT